MTRLPEWEELTVHVLVVVGSSHITDACLNSKATLDKAIRDSIIDFSYLDEDLTDDVDESIDDFRMTDVYDDVQKSSPFHMSVVKRVQYKQTDVKVNDKANPLFCKKMEEYILKYYVPFAHLWTGMLLGNDIIVKVFKNEIFSHSLIDIPIVLFAYPIKLSISTRKLHNFHQRSCVIILIDFSNAIKKMLDKISLHRH